MSVNVWNPISVSNIQVSRSRLHKGMPIKITADLSQGGKVERFEMYQSSGAELINNPQAIRRAVSHNL